MRSLLGLLLLAFLVSVAPDAGARDTEHFFSAQEAAESDVGRTKLFEEAFYLKGQKHPKVAKRLGQHATDQSTRGVFRSDEDSCHVAFISAIRELQVQARRKGGDGVVDIVSITRGKETSSATQFRCIAGATIVHVGLRGTLVKLAK